MNDECQIEERTGEDAGIMKLPPLDMSQPAVGDLSECKCIHKVQVGYRILQTQRNGKILKQPEPVGANRSQFEAVTIEEEFKGDGSFAVMTPMYSCGHDHFQWEAYWNPRKTGSAE